MDKLTQAREYFREYLTESNNQYEQIINSLPERKKKTISKTTEELSMLLSDYVDNDKLTSILNKTEEIVHKNNTQSIKALRGSGFERMTLNYINDLVIPNHKIVAYPINNKTWSNKSNLGQFLLTEMGYKPDGFIMIDDEFVIPYYCQISLWSRSPDRLFSLRKSQETFKKNGIDIIFFVARPFNLESNSKYESVAIVEGYLNKNIIYLNMVKKFITNVIEKNLVCV